MIVLSPCCRGTVKFAFSIVHLPPGSFLIGCVYQFLSVYNARPFTSTHTSSLKPSCIFFDWAEGMFTVVFSQTKRRCLLAPSLRVRLISPMRSAVIGSHLVLSLGIQS